MKKNNPKAPKRREKKYIPKKDLNPEVFSKRISMLNDKIDKNSRLAEMKEHALYEHIALMTNFVSHDLKNAIHNLDGYVNTLDISNVRPEDIAAINECIENIRKTISDFKDLSPDRSKNEFHLSELGKVVELLNRGTLNTNNIAVIYEYDKSDKVCIKQSLHNVTQMINNLILNATKALSQTKDKQLFISMKTQEEEVIIKVCDNGVGIKDSIKDKIFNLHFSTTGGSGIGLYHAKYIVESMNGSISYSRDANNYNTVFTLKFPIYEQSVSINNR